MLEIVGIARGEFKIVFERGGCDECVSERKFPSLSQRDGSISDGI